MLKNYLGEERFLVGMQLYFSRWALKHVNEARFVKAMEDGCGEELDWFFDQWAHLAGNPKLSASHSYDAEKGTVRVQLRQTHKASGLIPRFQLPVEVEIATEDSRIERIWLDGDEAAVQVSVSSAPRYVAVDPRGGLLARIENKQSAAQWAAQLTSKHPYAQELALRGLRKLEGAARDGVRDDVYALLASPDAPLAHRLGAVEILAHWRGPEDVTTLLSTLSSQRGPGGSALLRAELAGGLGSVLPSEAVIKTLERVLNTDPVDQVRARALTALGRLEEERARPRAIAALRSARSDNMSIQRSAARVLGRWGQVDDLAALSGARAAGTHSGLQVAALWASVKIAERERRGRDRDRARAKLLPDAEKMLWDRHLRSRQTAVSVLGQVGDNGSVAALTALLGREDYRELRESVSSAIESIRSRRDTEPDTTEGEVNAKLKGIEKRLKELEQDLQKVQERR